MNQKHNSRLKNLEAELKDRAEALLWVDVFDNRARMDIISGTQHRRGETVEFENVLECAAWLNSRIKESPSRVRGLAFFSNIADLFPMESRAVFDGETHRPVLLALNRCDPQVSLYDTALITWKHGRDVMARAAVCN